MIVCSCVGVSYVRMYTPDVKRPFLSGDNTRTCGSWWWELFLEVLHLLLEDGVLLRAVLQE